MIGLARKPSQPSPMQRNKPQHGPPAGEGLRAGSRGPFRGPTRPARGAYRPGPSVVCGPSLRAARPSLPLRGSLRSFCPLRVPFRAGAPAPAPVPSGAGRPRPVPPPAPRPPGSFARPLVRPFGAPRALAGPAALGSPSARCGLPVRSPLLCSVLALALRGFPAGSPRGLAPSGLRGVPSSALWPPRRRAPAPGALRGPSARFWWPPAPGAFRWRAAACRRLRCLGGCGVLPASPPPLPPRWGSRGARGLRPWGLPPPPFGLPLLSGVLPLPFPPLSHCPPRLKASLRLSALAASRSAPMRCSFGLDPLRAFLSGGLDILARLWYICLARPVPLLRGLPHLGYPWTAGKPLGLSTRRFFYALWPVRCPSKIAPLIFQRSTKFTGPGAAFSLE